MTIFPVRLSFTLGYLLSFLFVFIGIVDSLCAEPIRVGLSAPLTTGWGEDQKNVLLFANEKLANNKYSFVFEDDNCGISSSITVMNKLVAVDRVKYAFVVCGQSTIASAPGYAAAGIPVFASLATPSRISKLGVFRTALSDDKAAAMLAKSVKESFPEVSVLSQEDGYTISFLDDFTKAARTIGLKVDNETFLPDQHDFRLILSKLKQRGVKALFLNTQTEATLFSLVKQLKTLRYHPQLYGAYLPGSETFLKMGGDLAEGLEFVDFPGALDLLNEEGKKLYHEYGERFGPMKGWTFAFPGTFEAFRALHLAETSGQPAKKFLLSTTFHGIFGDYSFNEHGDIVGPLHELRVIRSGKSEILNTKIQRSAPHAQSD